MNNEKEIFECKTGLGVNEDFFAQSQAMTKEDMLPIFSQLAHLCDKKITESGLYEVRLKLVKVK